MTEIIVAALSALILAGAGGLLTTIGPWYRGLRKPSWQPPDWAFGPAWTLILGMAAASAVLAWRGAAPDARTGVVLMFAANAVFHLAWTPLFFNLRRPDWALAEVVLLWLSLVVLVMGLWPHSHTASLLILPYLAWVTFAAYLNLTIVRLNAPFGAVPAGVIKPAS